MATRDPLVIIGGQVQALPSGDEISGVPGSSPSSKTFGYTNGQLTTVVSTSGTKTLAYSNGLLDTISDTATSTLSTFGYTSGVLSSITVTPL